MGEAAGDGQREKKFDGRGHLAIGTKREKHFPLQKITLKDAMGIEETPQGLTRSRFYEP